MRSDIDTNLVSIGARVPQMASHESRLTELVRVASQKQEEIEKLKVNLSHLTRFLGGGFKLWFYFHPGFLGKYVQFDKE